jgi:hypothetical protein
MEPQSVAIGPVVQVMAKEPARGAMLEDVAIRQLGDRYFITGRLVGRTEDDTDERVGLTFWFALEEVVMLTEYPSVAAVREARDRYDEKT